MGKIWAGIKAIFGLIILLVLIGALWSPHEAPDSKTTGPENMAEKTKTAYTNDEIHFISKERVEENIKFGYANPGDYKEVQVPLNTVVVGASIIPEEISKQEDKTSQLKLLIDEEASAKSTTISPSQQMIVDTAIAEKLVKYDAIKEAIVKDNIIMVSVADSSQDGKESALRTIANVLMYGYISTSTKRATFYIIYLNKKMLDGSYYDIGESVVYSTEIEEALSENGSIAAKLTLGDKMIQRLTR